MQEKTNFKAEIVADSINEFGNRLTTFVVVFPRIVLAEFNTHRMLSRNSASSRAVPFKKMLKRVEENPFIPIRWMKDHKGMQGNEYHEGINLPQRKQWLDARDWAIKCSQSLNNLNTTKQFCNRLLEPFMWHMVIVTASEWENFFALRAHEAAEIHIQKLAYMMLDEYNNHQPKQLKAGEWHIPFGDRINLPSPIPIDEGLSLEEGIAIRKVKIATARCARVSYFNYEGKDDYEADIKLHDMLAKMGHWSPFEHCAKSMTEDETHIHILGGKHLGSHQKGWCGNFRGFIQYRKMFETENRTDERVK